jgi:3-hydroxyisobutyrate dehydrogenase-like beta-hydroxyacid dehydrogenase
VTLRICIFGLGEAGGTIAADLVLAGCDVHGFDPRSVSTPNGVTRHSNASSAVAASSGVDIICALTASADAPAALAQVAGLAGPGTVYADFSTSAAGLKTSLAASALASELSFVDIALMAPVPGKGLRTPSLASGPGAERFLSYFGPLGMPVEYAGAEAGLAATRKLLRSIVIKGFAALLIESMSAANAAGLGDETWDNLVDQFSVADEALLRRIIEGTGTHALRRLHEMEAAADMCHELGIDPVMTESTVESLRRITNGAALPALP